ncbi:MAG: hypothetical protein ABSG62_06320 [Terracidiphilus sp.]
MSQDFQYTEYPLSDIRYLFAYTGPVDNVRDSTYRVLMNFMARPGGWHISFLEKDCRTVLPLKLTFAKEDKIRAMHDRCGSQLQEDRQALEHGLNRRRGSCWLSLTAEQYQALNLKPR